MYIHPPTSPAGELIGGKSPDDVEFVDVSGRSSRRCGDDGVVPGRGERDRETIHRERVEHRLQPVLRRATSATG